MNKIENLFKDVAIVQPGGWVIYTKKDAIRFVEECKRESMKILGIDGFFFGKSSIQPSLENSVDFSSLSYEDSQDFYFTALSFLEQRDESLFFEIVCENI